MAAYGGLRLYGHRFAVTGVRGYRGGLHLLDEGDETGEALLACGLVAGDGVVGSSPARMNP